jgi:hypothetical protein
MLSGSIVTKVKQTAPNKVPLLNAGTISPSTLADWENGCEQYFVHKELADDKLVKHSAGGLLDPLMAAWYRADKARYDTLTFTEFMKELCAAVLDARWEDTT